MRPSVAQIWNWLDQVPDPEIPVISITDLGIVRDVFWDRDILEISVTPTYSGCPATSVIAMEIETAMRGHGINEIRVKSQLSPPWTTDWINAEARIKLENYGVAPPQPGTGRPERCPQCKSSNVSRVSQFGSTPCKAQWRCDDCLEPFDYFKCI
jgi:ring-1,2-phenylacetyl-CoA epoxidase subunit PaaD